MSAEMQVTVTTVCSLPPGRFADAVTADGHVIAFCPEDDGRLRFLWDGVAGEPFDALGELRDKSASIFMSDDGAHIAYSGRRGETFFIGRDTSEDQPFEAVSRSVPPTFSAGGRHLVYGAKVAGGDYRLIFDGVPVGTETVAPIAPVFSPDGERLVYMEMRGESRHDTECRIVLDGVPGEWFAGSRNAPGAMQFSPDSRRFAYYAIDGNGHARWFVDGVPQRLFNEAPAISLSRLRGIGVTEPPMLARFSPDSQRFAYFADVVEKGVAILEDDVPGPLLKALRGPVFSPDSRHLAYVGQTYGNAMALVLDGMVIAEWPVTHCSDAVFSPDSRRVAVMLGRETGGFLRKRKHHTVAVDGRMFPEEPAEDASLVPEFSPDGARIVWWLQRGAGAVLVVDGVIQRDAAEVVSDLRFDPLGRIVYAGAVGESQTIIVDGRPGPLADAVLRLVTAGEVFGREPLTKAPAPFRLSADGAHVAWGGVFDDRHCPVFDDEVGPAFDGILECAFDDGGGAIWWAQRGQDVVRVARTNVAAG